MQAFYFNIPISKENMELYSIQKCKSCINAIKTTFSFERESLAAISLISFTSQLVYALQNHLIKSI